MSRALAVILLAGILTLATPPPAPEVPVGIGEASAEITRDEAYKRGLQHYTERNFDGAIAAFREFLAAFPEGYLVDGAHYWLGESYFSKGERHHALREFEEVLTYPESRKRPPALLKKGMILLDLGEKDRGLSALQELVRVFPKTREAELACRYTVSLSLQVVDCPGPAGRGVGGAGGPPSEVPRAGEPLLHEFSGSGLQTTRPFTVQDSWEIQWDFRGRPRSQGGDGGHFGITIYTATGKLAGVAANQIGPGRGAAYQPRGGSYYLEISGIGDWTVRVIQLAR